MSDHESTPSCSTATTRASATGCGWPSARARRPTSQVRVRRRVRPTTSASRLVDDYEIDLLVLDGEAAPAGGLGIARQLKDEIDDCPPTCVVIARAADRWLAAYAQVDATLMHPLDPIDHRPDRRRRCCATRVRWLPVAQLTAATDRLDRLTEARHGRPHLAQPARRAAARRGAVHARTPPGRWARSWPGEATPAQIAGVRDRAARQGRDRRPRSPAWSRPCSPTPRRSSCREDVQRATPSTWSAPAATGPTPSTSPPWPRSSSPAPACGWSSTATGPPRPPAAPPTCWSTSASRSTSARTRWPRCVAEAGIGFCFAARFHPGMRHAARAPARAGRADRLQLPRPADQPGPARAPARSAAPTRGWRR